MSVPSRTVRRLGLRLLGATLLVALQPCVGSCSETEWHSVDLAKSADLKRAGFAKLADHATAGVKKYAPKDLLSGVSLPAAKGDRRLVLRGKGGASPGSVQLTGAQGRGRFVLGATLAVAAADGLSSGASFAEFGVVELAGEGAEPNTRTLRVTWRDDTPAGFGLHVVAFDSGAETPELGELLLDGARELELRLLQTDAGLDYLVRDLGGGGEGDPGFQLLATRAGLPPGDFALRLGADGLQPGGAFYLDHFWFLGPDLGPAAESTEGVRLADFTEIASCLRDALAILEGESPTPADVVDALELVSSARTVALATRLLLAQDKQAGAFAEGTPVKPAIKLSGQLFNKLDRVEVRLIKKLVAGKVGKKSLKGIRKQIAELEGRSRAGQALMLGVKATKFNQIDRGVPIASDDVPAGVL